MEGIVAPGEVGIWVSCARSQEAKAAREIVSMFDEVRVVTRTVLCTRGKPEQPTSKEKQTLTNDSTPRSSTA